MKRSINKHVRVSLIVSVVVVISILSFFLYEEINHPGFKEEKISLYSYNHRAQVNYRVYLKPNMLHSEESMGEGTTYISEFINYINTFFKYEFEGEEIADIQGDYQITTVVEGFTGEGEKYKTIWKKMYILQDTTPFQVEDKRILIQKEIPLNFNEYNNFVKKIIEDTKIGSPVKMTVFWDVNIAAKTDKGVIKEKIVPTMEIPLNRSYFEITGDLIQEKPGKIEKTEQVQLPVNNKVVIIYSCMISALAILLIFLIFFTEERKATDPLKKTIKQILKKHGDRLVALNSEAAVTCDSLSEVNSMDDLVRIADEIGKPIMYRYSQNLKDISKFYVIDDANIYFFKLIEKIPEETLPEQKENMRLKGRIFQFIKVFSRKRNKLSNVHEMESEKNA
ncbi:MAG: DUF5305 domain-containing protein [Bacillota bacterium]